MVSFMGAVCGTAQASLVSFGFGHGGWAMVTRQAFNVLRTMVSSLKLKCLVKIKLKFSNSIFTHWNQTVFDSDLNFSMKQWKWWVSSQSWAWTRLGWYGGPTFNDWSQMVAKMAMGQNPATAQQFSPTHNGELWICISLTHFIVCLDAYLRRPRHSWPFEQNMVITTFNLGVHWLDTDPYLGMFQYDQHCRNVINSPELDWLVISTPLKNMSSSVGIIIPNSQ